jgi:hypothetical protein
MGRKKKTNSKASSNKDDAFFVYEENKKETSTYTQDSPTLNNSTKNTIYVYKDKTSTTVCYDGNDPHYNIVHMG